MTQDSSRPLERYLSLLEVVAAAHRALSLTEITLAMDLPKPTVHRLVGALMEAGALEAEGTHSKTYKIGSRFRRLLMLGQDTRVVHNYAQLVCDELAQKLRETAYIVRLEHDSARTLTLSVPDQGYRLHVIPGADLPAHAAATARAMLAHQPAEVQQRVLREPFQKLTNRTRTKMEDVLRGFEQVRRQGYAVCDREIDPNVMAYAFPVHLPDVGVIYSVGVTGPCSRLNTQPASYWTQALQEAAQRFASLLGTLATGAATAPAKRSRRAD